MAATMRARTYAVPLVDFEGIACKLSTGDPGRIRTCDLQLRRVFALIEIFAFQLLCCGCRFQAGDGCFSFFIAFVNAVSNRWVSINVIVIDAWQELCTRLGVT